MTRAVSGRAGSAPGTPPDARSTLLVCMFHLNLAYSSLEEEQQPEIIERCYRPMLALAQRTPFPIAIEAPGWTLERIAAHDPGWIADARALIDAGRVELVGSGYAQCAAPLLPPRSTAGTCGWDSRSTRSSWARGRGSR